MNSKWLFKRRLINEVNREHLEQVLYDLLENAINSSHHERSLLIKISSKKQQGFDSLVIQDNGQGIELSYENDMAMDSQINHEAYGSNDFGLYLTQKAIERNGAQLRISSVQGEGTTYEIQIAK